MEQGSCKANSYSASQSTCLLLPNMREPTAGSYPESSECGLCYHAGCHIRFSYLLWMVLMFMQHWVTLGTETRNSLKSWTFQPLSLYLIQVKVRWALWLYLYL